MRGGRPVNMRGGRGALEAVVVAVMAVAVVKTAMFDGYSMLSEWTRRAAAAEAAAEAAVEVALTRRQASSIRQVARLAKVYLY